jgi:hypothetical protein
MTTGICWAASLPGGFVRATDHWRVEDCLRPTDPATWTMSVSANTQRAHSEARERTFD